MRYWFIPALLMVSIPAFATKPDLYGLCMGLRSGDTLKPEAKRILASKAFDQELDAALQDAHRVRDAACIIAETGRTTHVGALLQVKTEHLVPEVFSALIRSVQPGNEEQIRNSMKSWIQTPNREDHILKTLGALQVLGNLRWKPTLKEMSGLLDSTVPEIRMSSHDFLFQRFEQLGLSERQELMRASLKRDPLQVRVSAIRTYRSLKDTEKKALEIDLKDCKKDPEPEVREECP